MPGKFLTAGLESTCLCLLILQARQMRGQTVMLPVMRKQKQRGNLQVAVSFAACAGTSINSMAPAQQAAEQADPRPMGFCTTPSSNSTATGLWARLNSIGNRSTTPDHPQQRDQISTCPSNVSSVAVSLGQQQAQGGQAAQQDSTAVSVAPVPMQPSTTPTGHNSTTSSVTGAPHYPAVVSPCPGWPQANSTCPPSDAQSLLSSTAPPRTVDDCGRSEASYSVASMSTLSRADSGDTSCTSVDPRVTDLVRCSVDFRSELEQLLKMLKVAEQETSSSITWTERQIEQVAKVGAADGASSQVPAYCNARPCAEVCQAGLHAAVGCHAADSSWCPLLSCSNPGGYRLALVLTCLHDTWHCC